MSCKMDHSAKSRCSHDEKFIQRGEGVSFLFGCGGNKALATFFTTRKCICVCVCVCGPLSEPKSVIRPPCLQFLMHHQAKRLFGYFTLLYKATTLIGLWDIEKDLPREPVRCLKSLVTRPTANRTTRNGRACTFRQALLLLQFPLLFHNWV